MEQPKNYPTPLAKQPENSQVDTRSIAHVIYPRIQWHRRLGHISIKRIKRLVNEGVLNTLDFSDFETCVDCIKGKQTNKSKKGTKRSLNLLEIIHTYICCPDMDASSPKYFITFIDDYS